MLGFHLVCLSLLEKPLFFKLDCSSTHPQQISFLSSLLLVISTDHWQLLDPSKKFSKLSICLINSWQILDPSRFLGFLLIAARRLLNLSRSSCMHCFSHVLHLSFILSSIAFCFITFMHFYGFFVNMWFLFKILHVRGRNTCLCKGEMCFILLGRVLTCFFLYTCLVTMLTYIVHIFFICWCMFLLLISTCVVSFLYLYTCFFICMQSIIFVSHKNALMSFV